MITTRKILKNHILASLVAFALIICFFSALLPAKVYAIATPYSGIITITTPKGNIVDYAYIVAGEFTQTEIDQANDRQDSLYPNALRIRSATGKYNCHSYAWYSTATGNNIWIAYATSYISDGSYTIIAVGNSIQSPPSNVPNGSKA